MYKIHVNTESQGNPENIYSGPWGQPINPAANLKYREWNDKYPECLCLLPSGEKAPKGEYETDGERKWLATKNLHYPVIIEDVKYYKSIGWEAVPVYIVTTPANEQPKFTNEEYLDLHGHDDEKYPQLKPEISSNEYFKLDEKRRNIYKQVTLQREPYGWVERFMFGGPYTQELKTVYRTKDYKENPLFKPANEQPKDY